MRFCLYRIGPGESNFIRMATIMNNGKRNNNANAEIIMSLIRFMFSVLSLISAREISINGSPMIFDTRALAVIRLYKSGEIYIGRLRGYNLFIMSNVAFMP